jgi:NAD(P)-dependent dehydrogenase (short-subunit alcohol dehydrogenase family)
MLIALTRVQQRMFDQDARKDIIINAVCPGLVTSNFFGHVIQAQTPEEG